MTGALTALLEGIIDYAGLFPPASASMEQTVRNYRAYLRCEHEWMLARLIVPVSRLEELARAAGGVLGGGSDQAWRLSALPLTDWGQDLKSVESFNRRYAGKAVIDALECKADSASDIEKALQSCPDSLQPYFEVAIDDDLDTKLAALQGTRGRAKIRTGGIEPQAIPSGESVARFLIGCARRRVGFKATAGLHHPLRSRNPLSYRPDSPQAVMHGFINLFLAAVWAYQGAGESEVSQVLFETDPQAFCFEPGRASWRGHYWERAEIESARRRFAISFGSCSFDEPLDDLERMGLL